MRRLPGCFRDCQHGHDLVGHSIAVLGFYVQFPAQFRVFGSMAQHHTVRASAGTSGR